MKHLEDDAANSQRTDATSTHAFDELYADFEDKFRGSRDDVKGRVAVYVPRLIEAGLGTSEAPVLDLGCGRGEWLELLKKGVCGRKASTPTGPCWRAAGRWIST